MRSARSKVGILLSFIGIASLISAFMVTGVSRSSVAYARSASSVTTFQGKHSLGRPSYSGQLNLSDPTHQALPSHVQHLMPFKRPQGANSFAGVRQNAPLSGTTAMGSGEGGVLHNFNGLNSLDSFNVNGFVLEPPDQGLCVGSLNGTKAVGEIVNDVIAFYTPGGSLLSSKIDLNTFFHAPPPSSPVGLGDPRCYFDASTGSWFFSAYESDFATFARFDLLVLNGSTLAEKVYKFDTTNAVGSSICPCFGDQPHLGVDSQNVYITYDEFGLTTPPFDGAVLFAISKSQLIGGGSVNFVAFGPLSLAGIPITTLQPAFTTNSLNEEFLLNSFPYDAGGNNNTFSRTLGLWSLSDTESITAGGIPTLSGTTITSELYAFPAAALTTNGLSLATFSNDSRMQQVQYINGQVWATLDTAVLFSGHPAAFDGIAWFEIRPQIDSSGNIAGATFTHQGYVASAGNYLVYPAIEHTAEGTTGIAFSITNPTLNPSTAYVVRSSDDGSFGDIHITGVGSGPDNGFTCALGFPQQCRWGDYSWAALDPNGDDIWMAGEYIVPPVATSPRGSHTNWGTHVWDVEGED